MKKFLLFAAAVIGGVFLWRKFFVKKNALGDHLAEEAALQRIGQIATRSSIEAMPVNTSQELVPVQTAIGQVWLPPSLAGGGPEDQLYGYRRNQWGIPVMDNPTGGL
ncbi:MAG: hypothetical protein FD161_59 [Limisphaerales bacterium]|nr:MAG: hypothetical protein FD161_59 [Limisphaerales bacterium]KAG0510505.1 MAG: hypothetical protein E1N63_59 [Limisphaerales bacterium]TXT52778.1 MAG: hypothetical protein FD140_321 [Limisphaerales bacterium]